MLDARSQLSAERMDEMSDAEVEHEIALLEEMGRKFIAERKDTDGDIAALFNMKWYSNGTVPRRSILKQLRGIVLRYVQKPKEMPVVDPLSVIRATPGSPRAQILTIVETTRTIFADDLRMPAENETTIFKNEERTTIH